ncbi:MAG: hypothetical protein PVI78_05095 [Anaerolineales bacterium]
MREPHVKIYICSRCLTAEGEPGACQQCGLQLIACQPGAKDDPQRRPLMDDQGNLRSHAPIWWLKHTMGTWTIRLEKNQTRD